MSGILETFGLTKNLKLTVDMEKSKFIEFLQKKIKPNSLFFFDIFDIKQKEFYGNVNEEFFWLRVGAKSIRGGSFANAHGKMKSYSNKTELNIKITGWNWFILLWFLGISLIFGLVLNDIIRTESFGILIVFGPIFLFFYLIGIIKIRNGVRKLERFLISELNEK